MGCQLPAHSQKIKKKKKGRNGLTADSIVIAMK